jgi:hypothetical protein
MWLHQDPWLISVGLAATAFALLIHRTRPFAIGLVIQVLMLIKGGYIPFAFIIASLPMLTLVIAGVADTWWKLAVYSPRRVRHAEIRRRLTQVVSVVSRTLVLLLAIAFAVLALPSWGNALVSQSHADAPASTIAAEQWVKQHVPAGDVVVVNDYMWTDLAEHSKVKPLWLWKIDLDPAVMKDILPKGWRSIDYIIWAPQSTAADLSELPTLKAALEHSKLEVHFGDDITAYKVQDK